MGELPDEVMEICQQLAKHLEKLRVPFTLLWHKRNSYNPKLVWLRDTLKALYSGTL